MKRSRALVARPRSGGGASNQVRLSVGLVSFLLSLLVMGMAPAKAQPSLESIVAQFEEVAFGNEHGNSVRVVRKWTRSPDIALFTSPGYDINAYMRTISDHLKQIESLTGLPVRLARIPAEATLRLGFYPRAEFVNMPGNRTDPEYVRWISTSACIALAMADRQEAGRIAVGAIAIGTDIPPAQREHCILEELVQVLGLPNDACHYRPSLFCESDRVFQMTGADRILLRTLYDPRLVPGTPRNTAMPIVRLVVADLMARRVQEH